MNFTDRERLSRIIETLRTNYRVSRLFSAYLTRCPEAISESVIKAMTEDGGITREEAIGAILSELFSLDTTKSEDRIIERRYIPDSIRLLNANKYRQNPYYKNVKIQNIRDGDWELRLESYEPYRAVVCDDMIVKDGLYEVIPLGFFTERFDFPAVLEGGNEWMTLTPVDLDTCEEAIAAARGKVVTFGLGLGYYAYMVARKPEVESITVIEKSPDVIRLFKKHIFPYFENKEKVRIINADAFEYAENIMPTEGYDYAFVDTWRDASDGAPMYQRMRALEHLSPATEFSYWIREFLVSRIRSERLAKMLDDIDRGFYPESFDAAIEYLTNI